MKRQRRTDRAEQHARWRAASTVFKNARFLLVFAAALLAAPMSRAGTSHVIVVRRGWHIDVGMPAAELGPQLQFVAAALPGMRYLFFGFGDKHYLESRSHGASTLAAALWPGRGIMLVTGLDASPLQGFGAKHVIELALSAAQSSALQDFIAGSFVTVNGSAQVYEPGPYQGSVYFLAVPGYSALHTCNTWASEALRAARLHVHSFGVLFAGQLWSQAARLRRLEEAAAPGAIGQQPGQLP
jgi:hypothetical protein